MTHSHIRISGFLLIVKILLFLTILMDIFISIFNKFKTREAPLWQNYV